MEDRIKRIDSTWEKTQSIKIDEEKIKQIVRKLFFDRKISLRDNELHYEIINITKCDMIMAKSIFNEMNNLGLRVCIHLTHYNDIAKFAALREYVSSIEFRIEQEKREVEFRKREEEYIKKTKEFFEKFGDDKSKWSEEVQEEYCSL